MAEGFPTPSVSGSELTADSGERLQLAAPALAPLTGSLAPTATGSPDGHLIAYNTWRELVEIDQEQSLEEQGIESGTAVGIPVVRILDTSSGSDTALEDGSLSPAFRWDGALAYVRGVEPAYRVNERYLGQIVVRDQLDGDPIVWLDEPGRYVVYGWSGDRLIAYRIAEGERLEVLVLDAPGVVRTLRDGAGVIAIGPTGRDILLVDSTPPAQIRLLELASGKEVASLDLDAVTAVDGSPVTWASYSGDWRGDRAVATGGPGVLVLALHGGRIAIESAHTIDLKRYPGGIVEPRFVDASGEQIVAWSLKSLEAGSESVLDVGLVCDLAASVCEETEPGDPRVWHRIVYSTSKVGEHQ
ncbi:MAG: hypothetical protein U0R69_02430 [Gaiellales bacterium]